MLARENLTDVLENYAQVVEAKDEKTGRKKRTQIWPRYTPARRRARRLLADAAAHGAGRRYLIQHSAGSGKSPSRVAADAAFRNARQNSDDANARIEHDKVLARIVTGMVKDDAELFKQFMDNEDFRRWMTDRVFELSCEQTTVP